MYTRIPFMEVLSTGFTRIIDAQTVLITKPNMLKLLLWMNPRLPLTDGKLGFLWKQVSCSGYLLFLLSQTFIKLKTH